MRSCIRVDEQAECIAVMSAHLRIPPASTFYTDDNFPIKGCDIHACFLEREILLGERDLSHGERSANETGSRDDLPRLH